jgi:hypothetical protein
MSLYIMTFMVILLLTKSPCIKFQLKCIYKQTIKPDYLMIIQIGNYMDITHLKKKYDFIHVKQESEVPFHRFYQALCYNVDYYFFIEIEHLPRESCFEYYIQQCERLNSIIGFAGCISKNNKNIESEIHMFASVDMKVDYLTKFICIKNEHLKNFFSMNKKECHMNTYHEFMYLCYINKIKNVDSRIILNTHNRHCRHGRISDTILRENYTINYKNCKISDIILKKNYSKNYKNFVHLQKEPKPINEVTQLIDEYFINEYDFKFIDNII